MSNLSSGTWIDSFPYDTDYCDHFETPPQAYDDIAPILDLLLLSTQKPSRSKVTIYDPYFCDGRAGRVLRELGFQVQHDKRDFYKDIQNGEIPHHDILVTNPPFSDQHKKKCLEFCFAQLRGPTKRPFAILMPNYVAAREYYKKLLSQQSNKEDVVYFIPVTTYHYDHPDGTGKDTPPFESLWFIGVNEDRDWNTGFASGKIAESLKALSTSNESFKRIFQKRPNPKQRKKTSKKRAIELGTIKISEMTNPRFVGPSQSASNQHRKTSKYRDATGLRKQGRF